MWLSFCVAAIFAIVFFAVPGLLFFRALRFGWCASVCLAPVFSIACYGVLCVLFGMGGIACSWASVFGVAIGIGALACLVSVLAVRAVWGKPPLSGCGKLNPMPLPSVAVGATFFFTLL